MALAITEALIEYTPPSSAEASSPQVSASEKLAQGALMRLFDWAKDSPGAKQWLDQEENSAQIKADLLDRLDQLTFEHANHDTFEIYALYDFEGDTDHAQQSSGTKIYQAMDIAYAGICQIVQKAQSYPIRGGIEYAEEVRQSVIQSIGAQLVRLHYLETLAAQQPSVLTPERFASFRDLYRQNTMSDMERVALIQGIQDTQTTRLHVASQ